MLLCISIDPTISEEIVSFMPQPHLKNSDPLQNFNFTRHFSRFYTTLLHPLTVLTENVSERKHNSVRNISPQNDMVF